MRAVGQVDGDELSDAFLVTDCALPRIKQPVREDDVGGRGGEAFDSVCHAHRHWQPGWPRNHTVLLTARAPSRRRSTTAAGTYPFCCWPRLGESPPCTRCSPTPRQQCWRCRRRGAWWRQERKHASWVSAAAAAGAAAGPLGRIRRRRPPTRCRGTSPAGRGGGRGQPRRRRQR